MIREELNKVLDGEHLTANESHRIIDLIMSGKVSHVKIAAFLTALRQKGETSDEIIGAARVMRDKVVRIKHNQDFLFDNCGTGGDGAGTFNISTTTSFVLAGCGLAIGKHGNRSVSSKCGSADVLQALGVEISLDPEQVGLCIDEIGIGFMFAPNLHPAMKEVVPVRKELGFRTIFNLLGPMTNPAFATDQMIGVYDGSYTSLLAKAAGELGIKRVGVVYNECGIDEITTAGLNKISMVSDGKESELQLNPEEYGFKKCDVNELAGGTAEENARITRSILNGENGPRRDTIILNTAVGLFIAGWANDIKEGIEQANESIDSGQASEMLDKLVHTTKRFSNA
ncbi:MAG: anthranilate phosphoribosyltransferase [candidate division Zixibacteria bacterium]|nr:anthranilate phosphoribosyltransferase [candidate division Zixibacteria bacterium]